VPDRACVTEQCKGANKQESGLLYFSLHFSTAFISNKILSVDHWHVAFAWWTKLGLRDGPQAPIIPLFGDEILAVLPITGFI